MKLRHISLIILLSAVSLAAQTVTVTVDAGKIIAPINPLLYGINTARWDESLFPGPVEEMLATCDRDAIAKIKASGVTLLKYPGGNDADHYVWNSKENNASEMETDEYLALCRETGAEAFITINFNEPPQLAADWVRYCNITQGYNVKYWEVGDEQWGSWSKGHSTAQKYAERYIQFVKAMKAVDPSIKVATNVALAGNSPSLGSTSEGWTAQVLRIAGEYVDMLTISYYPQQFGKENDDTLLASTANFKKLFTQLRTEVERVAGRKKAEEILYINVGYNSVDHSPGPQTLQLVNALWTADMLGTMAETRTDIACYWAVHNAFPPRKGDYGYLSSEGSNTRNVSYFVFPMFVRHFGESLVEASSSDELLSVYAARTGKKLSLFVINKDKTSTKTFSLTLLGFVPQQTARQWVLDETHTASETAPMKQAGGMMTAKVSPYSLTAIEFVASDSVFAPVNIAGEAVPSASSFSAIGPNFGPQSAIDGKLYTQWNSAAWTKSEGKESQSYQLAWNEPRTIISAKIYWGDTRAINYTLDYSINGKEWKTIKEISNGSGRVDEFNFQPLTVKYLRMTGTRGSGGRGAISVYRIREFEVFAR